MEKYIIDIDKVKCIKCGKCVRVCPSMVFAQDSPKDYPQVVAPENCIACAHCVSVCPTGAVIHSLFPPEKVHVIDRGQLPSPEQVMLLIKSRRSNRAFSKEPVPSEYLDAIIEAAHLAPTASNLQRVEFTLVTDPEKLREISRLTLDTFNSLADKMSYPVVKPIIKKISPETHRLIPRFRKLQEAFDQGYDPIMRGATSALFIHTPKSVRFGSPDCNLAYQNGSLMAESLGVSQFYTGFVCTAIQQDKKRRINQLLGTANHIHAGMALGMPMFLYPSYAERRKVKVNKL